MVRAYLAWVCSSLHCKPSGTAGGQCSMWDAVDIDLISHRYVSMAPHKSYCSICYYICVASMHLPSVPCMSSTCSRSLCDLCCDWAPFGKLEAAAVKGPDVAGGGGSFNIITHTANVSAVRRVWILWAYISAVDKHPNRSGFRYNITHLWGLWSRYIAQPAHLSAVRTCNDKRL